MTFALSIANTCQKTLSPLSPDRLQSQACRPTVQAREVVHSRAGVWASGSAGSFTTAGGRCWGGCGRGQQSGVGRKPGLTLVCEALSYQELWGKCRCSLNLESPLHTLLRNKRKQ